MQSYFSTARAPRERGHGRPALALVLLLALVAGRAAAQPANDFFVVPNTLTGQSGSVLGDTTGATLEPNEPLVFTPFGGIIPNGASVWYRWIAPASGTVFFNTFTSPFDTVLSSYTGTNILAIVQLAANDDFAKEHREAKIEFVLPTNGTYYLSLIDAHDAGSALHVYRLVLK